MEDANDGIVYLWFVVLPRELTQVLDSRGGEPGTYTYEVKVLRDDASPETSSSVQVVNGEASTSDPGLEVAHQQIGPFAFDLSLGDDDDCEQGSLTAALPGLNVVTFAVCVKWDKIPVRFTPADYTHEGYLVQERLIVNGETWRWKRVGVPGRCMLESPITHWCNLVPPTQVDYRHYPVEPGEPWQCAGHRHAGRPSDRPGVSGSRRLSPRESVAVQRLVGDPPAGVPGTGRGCPHQPGLRTARRLGPRPRRPRSPDRLCQGGLGRPGYPFGRDTGGLPAGVEESHH